MGDPKGFLKIARKEAGNRPVHERIYDYGEVEQTLNNEDRRQQAARCMDCGVPFCHWGCPTGNVIPEWNDALHQGDWKRAYDLLKKTNNFPEFTGRICPAPCEHACVLNIEKIPVTIRENEAAIAEYAFDQGYVKPSAPPFRTGMKVAVIGSGPAGLACADLLNMYGHTVTVFEKESKAGGLLRYGIPDFKLSKFIIDRRLKIMIEEGVMIKTGVHAGKDITAAELLKFFDAVCIATGSIVPRNLDVQGRNLEGIHYAMDFLSQQNKLVSGEYVSQVQHISAKGKKVLVIGGGDTGSDCIGTSIRQGASKIMQIEIMNKPPLERAPGNPWPYYARILKNSSSHDEGCERRWGLSTVRFHGHEGHVTHAEVVQVRWDSTGGKPVMKIDESSAEMIETDLVLLAMGFIEPEKNGLLNDLSMSYSKNNHIRIDGNYHTEVPKVFAAGDSVNGPTLVVNAINSGRRAAEKINDYLKMEKAG